MSDTASTDFASVTSDDVRPGETPAQARSRRKTEANRAKRAAAKSSKPTEPVKPAPAAAESTRPAPATEKAPPARPVGRPTNKARRAQSTLGVISMVGVAVRPFNAADSDAILNGADALAESLAEVAETNRTVAKALDAISGTSAWAGVALAVYAIAAPIAINHGVFGLGQPAPVTPGGNAAPAEPEPYLPPSPGAPDFDPSAIRWSAAAGVQ